MSIKFKSNADNTAEILKDDNTVLTIGSDDYLYDKDGNKLNSVLTGYHTHTGTLLAGTNTIDLPWTYDTTVGVDVYLGGLKQSKDELIFVDNDTVQLTESALNILEDIEFEVCTRGGTIGLDAGVSGTFVTVDNKTITITNGIVTSIIAN